MTQTNVQTQKQRRIRRVAGQAPPPPPPAGSLACPASVDPDVWTHLPDDYKQEHLLSKQRRRGGPAPPAPPAAAVSAPRAAAAAAAAGGNGGPWVCPRCTLRNSGGASVCGACGGPAAASPPQTAATAAPAAAVPAQAAPAPGRRVRATAGSKASQEGTLVRYNDVKSKWVVDWGAEGTSSYKESNLELLAPLACEEHSALPLLHLSHLL